MTRTYNQLLQAVDGNKSQLARLLKVSPSLLASFEERGYIPEKYALAAGEAAESLDIASVPVFTMQVLRQARECRRATD